MLNRRLALLIIILAGLCAYWNSFHGPFIFDDRQNILHNQSIRQFWPVWKVFTESSRPVVQFTLAANYAHGKLAVEGYHYLNLVIHLLCAVTLFGIVRRTLLLRQKGPSDNTATGLAFAVALLWVVHPLQTESVTYIIQRGESLMSLFYLATLYTVIRGAAAPKPTRWYIAAVAACALGMGCKPVMATAPLVILCYDRAFLAKTFSAAWKVRRSLYCGLAGTWIALILLLTLAPKEWQQSAGFEFDQVRPLEYALTQPGVILHYLRLTFWPVGLCLDYKWPVANTAAEILPGLIIVGGLLIATIATWKRAPQLSFLGVWFFLILAPTSSFIPIADLAFEHRLYLPLAAVIVLVTIGIHTGLRRLPLELILLAGIATGLGYQTYRRNTDYRSEVAIWGDTTAKSPHNHRARYNYANALEREGKTAEAIAQYQETIRLKPTYADAHNNLGLALAKQGKQAEAIAAYREAARLKPNLSSAHFNLGLALLHQNKFTEAIASFAEVIRLNPRHPKAHSNTGRALLGLGRPVEARPYLEKALQLDPTLPGIKGLLTGIQSSEDDGLNQSE